MKLQKLIRMDFFLQISLSAKIVCPKCINAVWTSICTWNFETRYMCDWLMYKFILYLFSSSDQICTAFYVMLPSPWTCTLSIIHIISRKGVTEKKPICFNKYFENWPQNNFFHGFMASPKFFSNCTYFVVLWLVNFFSGVLIVSFIYMKDGRIITKIALYKSY